MAIVKTGGLNGYMHEDVIHGAGYKVTGITLDTTTPMYPRLSIDLSATSNNLAVNQAGLISAISQYLNFDITAYGITFALSPGGETLIMTCSNTGTFISVSRIADIVSILYFLITDGRTIDRNMAMVRIIAAMSSLAVGETLVPALTFTEYFYDAGIPSNSYFRMIWNKLAITSEYTLDTKEVHDTMIKNPVKNELGIDLFTGTYSWIVSELTPTAYNLKFTVGTLMDRTLIFNQIFHVLKGFTYSNILLAYRVLKDVAELIVP